MLHWTPEEDECLLSLYNQIHVYNRWKQISKRMTTMGFQKTELQCRNRYNNKIDPDLKVTDWSNKEIQKIFRYYNEYGPKWNLIQAFIEGRTQNSIKNRFFSTLKNLIRKLLKNYSVDLRYISSKDITELYEGRGKYKRFKGFMKKILKNINFEIEPKAIETIVQIYDESLQQLSALFQPLPSKVKPSQPSQQHALKLQPSKQSSNESQKNNANSEFQTEGLALSCLPIFPQDGFFFVPQLMQPWSQPQIMPLWQCP